VGIIDLYGYNDIDPEAVRRAPPFHTGDPYMALIKTQARETAQQIVGRPGDRCRSHLLRPEWRPVDLHGPAGRILKTAFV